MNEGRETPITGGMPPFRLKGTAGEHLNQAFPFAETLVIGSAPAADVVVASDDVGAQHARIEMAPDGWPRVRVLADSLPLRVNGEEVRETRLAPGDELQLGPSRWVFQAPGMRPDKVLTEEAVAPRRQWWPWAVALAAVAAAVATAYYLGWFGGAA